ncbi:MAG TPA: hypothetical protein VIL18_00910 [Longimicrobiales bacterium]
MTVRPSLATGAAPAAACAQRRVLVDAHVHLHACFELRTFLDSAAANFRRAAEHIGLPGDTLGCLCLVDFGPRLAFVELRERAGAEVCDGWTVGTLDEESSLCLTRTDGARLLLLAGQQIHTGDGLEVLALATTQRFQDGVGLEATVDRVLAAGALAAVPWGFGKWWLGRGRRVARLIERAPPGLFLGDNAGRPEPGPRSGLFDLAAERGVRVLPGTDPLPFRRSAALPGRYGFVLPDGLDPRRPAEGLRRVLLAATAQPRIFGRRARPLRFLRDQTMMNLKKYVGGLAA